MATYYLIRISLIIVLSVILKAFVPPRVRDHVTPFFAGWILFCETGFLTLPQWAIIVATFVNYIGMAFLLDGLDLKMMRKNGVLVAFLIFWGMLLASTLWGADTPAAFAYYVYLLLDLSLVGFYLGMWVVRRPDGLERLLKTMVVFGFVVIVLLVLKREALSGSLDDFEGRYAVSMESLGSRDMQDVNVNNFAVACSSILTISLVFVFMQGMRSRHKIAWCLSLVNVIVSVVLIIRTGSRNGALGLLPCALYALTARQRRSAWFAVVSNVLVIVGICIMVYFFTSDQGYLRAFDFSTARASSIQGSVMNQITSGRWNSFEAQISQMKGIDWLIGRGTVWAVYEAGANAVVWGALCIYVTVFVVSGSLGIFAMLCYFFATVRRSLQIGQMGRIALLMFAVWAILGVGEGESLMRGYVIRLYQGMSIAFCTRLCFRRPDECSCVTSSYGNYQHRGVFT